jgi:long-chain fatty acid transport protein
VSGGLAINQVSTIRAKALDNSNNIAAEGRAFIDAKDLNAHLGGGVAITPFKNDELRLGLSYQMPVGFGAVTMQGPLTIHDGFGGVTETEVDLHHVWPDVFRLGAAYKPMKELELRLFGDLTRWNLFEDQCTAEVGLDSCRDDEGNLHPEVIINLPRRWNVGIGVRAGASYWFADWVEAFLGVGYDNNAVPDDTLEPALLDFHDISVAAGAKLWVTEWFGLVASYTHLFYISRDNTGNSGLPEEDGNGVGPDAGGKYSQTVGVFNLGVHFAFDPFSDDAPAEEEAPAEDPAVTGKR